MMRVVEEIRNEVDYGPNHICQFDKYCVDDAKIEEDKKKVQKFIVLVSYSDQPLSKSISDCVYASILLTPFIKIVIVYKLVVTFKPSRN